MRLSWTDTLSAIGRFTRRWSPGLRLDSVRNSSSTLSRTRLLRGVFVLGGGGCRCRLRARVSSQLRVR